MLAHTWDKRSPRYSDRSCTYPDLWYAKVRKKFIYRSVFSGLEIGVRNSVSPVTNANEVPGEIKPAPTQDGQTNQTRRS